MTQLVLMLRMGVGEEDGNIKKILEKAAKDEAGALQAALSMSSLPEGVRNKIADTVVKIAREHYLPKSIPLEGIRDIRERAQTVRRLMELDIKTGSKFLTRVEYDHVKSFLKRYIGSGAHPDHRIIMAELLAKYFPDSPNTIQALTKATRSKSTEVARKAEYLLNDIDQSNLKPDSTEPRHWDIVSSLDTFSVTTEAPAIDDKSSTLPSSNSDPQEKGQQRKHGFRGLTMMTSRTQSEAMDASTENRSEEIIGRVTNSDDIESGGLKQNYPMTVRDIVDELATAKDQGEITRLFNEIDEHYSTSTEMHKSLKALANLRINNVSALARIHAGKIKRRIAAATKSDSDEKCEQGFKE